MDELGEAAKVRLQPGLGPAEMQTRTIWNSAKLRDVWQPRVREIDRQVVLAERLSVQKGVRTATQQCLSMQDYLNVSEWARRNNLYVHVRRTVKAFFGFAHRYEEGNDLLVTVIASKEWASEQPEMFLGYPACCIDRFSQLFPLIVDPVWQWAKETDKVFVSAYANPMLRYINVRFAPHIPCSYECEPSSILGYEMAQLMSDDAHDWAKELLREVTWDCYRGVSVVYTPYFRIVQASVPTAERYIVHAAA